MTVARSLVQWMQDNGYGTYNTDLFIGAIPFERKINAGWWVIGGGGSPTIKAYTGEKAKSYIYNIFYRNTDAEDVDNKLQQLEEDLNSKACKELIDYETIEVEATGFQSDSDLDAEDRSVGTVQVTITVYQSG